MDAINAFLEPILSAIPNILGTILLLLVAWIIAVIIRKLTFKGLEAIRADQRFISWGVAQDEADARGLLKTIAKTAYFLVFVFFLPAILQGLNIGGVMEPITNMFDKFFAFIPNIIGSILILVLAFYFCGFVRDIVQKLLERVNVDGKLAGLLQTDPEEGQTRSKGQQVAKGLSMLVYVLLFIPLLTAALEVLGIESIARPIVNLLNTLLAAIPNILVALVLMVVGALLAKLIGDLVENLLAAANIDSFTKYLNLKADANSLQLSAILGHAVKAVIGIFFLVQALNVLKLDVLTQIGQAIIAYLPLVLSALAILCLGVIGGNLLANFLKESTGSKFLANLVQYGLVILAIFMALDQLEFAASIVNIGFMLVVGGASVAFALAFGLGGRDFARKQLERLDQKINQKNEH
ncbi:mechanosensitive ion channel [Aerococcus sanguinicola]|uniref:Mechanosensitive ion channel n=1 Tax=Aerococcus sanguinicola TaxID=119206 RepID=A0A5N1GM79_9LACT|nr:mechanosensitive ion channel [Aerococcus sanguinicola]KAA9302085.1 mechanosensitive ion channel [Aerococcus sanguinicola]